MRKAYDRIAPDAAAEERMRAAVLSMARTEKAKKQTVPTRRLAVAACAVLLVGGGIAAVRSSAPTDTVTLANGDVLRFPKGTPAAEASYAYDEPVVSRALTAAECAKLLLGDLPEADREIDDGTADALLRSSLNAETVWLYGTFAESDGRLLRAEGRIVSQREAGDLRVNLSAPGIAVTDTGIGGNASTARSGDTVVASGRFLTAPDSRGRRTLILYAWLDLDGVNAYLEIAGGEDDFGAMGDQLAKLIGMLSADTTADAFAGITK